MREATVQGAGSIGVKKKANLLSQETYASLVEKDKK